MPNLIYTLKLKIKVKQDENVARRFKNYTHKCSAEKLATAMIDTDYNLDDYSQSLFDELLEYFENLK